VQAIKMKFLAVEQQKEKIDLKSVFHCSRYVFKSQARRVERLKHHSAFKI
jgi:hypothetical protein